MLTRRGLVLDKTTMTIEELASIRSDLRVVPKVDFANPFGNAMPPFDIYLESQNRLCVPRYYGIHVKKLDWIPSPKSYIAGPDMHRLEFTGTLNEAKQQVSAASKTIETCKTFGGGILSLPTGYGKTVVGISVMCSLKQKTLIVVHKDFLVDQWAQRIRQFAPTARIGYIRQNVTDTEDKDVVIGMLQSIVFKDYLPTMFHEFGLAIFDEVHHLSAPTFSQCLFKVCCPFMLGLSATPERKDGLSWVMEHFIGPVFYKVARRDQAHVAVHRLEVDSHTAGDLPRLPNGRYNATAISTLLCSDALRNAFLSKAILGILQTRPERKILVLSDRRAHCEELARRIGGSETVTVGCFLGGMKKERLKKTETCQVILATYSFANEGLDIAGLDTLVFATPKGDVVQAVGRVLRDGGIKAGDNVGSSEVYDVTDPHPYFESKYRIRKAFYKKCGFSISEVRDEVPVEDRGAQGQAPSFLMEE
jgi:superfamily II DNA or RNA helicase